jgi:hypothetical protein
MGLLLVPGFALAGLHYTGETVADLPARTGGFLMDHRQLLLIAREHPATPLRTRYLAEAQRLGALAKPSADELADLGALHLRLGDPVKALAVLRPAYRLYPQHFRLVANLGTAYHRAEEWTQAAACLEQAVKLAPEPLRKAEQLHLHLVRQRQRAGSEGLDDLFSVRYDQPESVKKLPSDALALIQQLVLWLPDDGRLLWQLAELVGVNGDSRSRAALLEGCVTEFNLRDEKLLKARKEARAAMAAAPPSRADHEGHTVRFAPRSARALRWQSLENTPGPINPDGINPLPWGILRDTLVDRRGRPTFARHLRSLDGKQVTLQGYMQPITDGTALNAFLLMEYPVGCWYCENPELVLLVLIELPEGKTQRLTREPLTLTGKLTLNATDPENFFYSIANAKIEGGSRE